MGPGLRFRSARATICLSLLCRFVFGGFTDSIMDFFMHAWVIYELYVGVRAARNLDE